MTAEKDAKQPAGTPPTTDSQESIEKPKPVVRGSFYSSSRTFVNGVAVQREEVAGSFEKDLEARTGEEEDLPPVTVGIYGLRSEKTAEGYAFSFQVQKGFDPKELNITYHQNVLKIDRLLPEDRTGPRISIARYFPNVDEEQISTDYKGDRVRIVLPLQEAYLPKEPKRIEINTKPSE